VGHLGFEFLISTPMSFLVMGTEVQDGLPRKIMRNFTQKLNTELVLLGQDISVLPYKI
jgi:hypothetical protein